MSSPDRYFVLGNPVAHSQSPFIHTAFAQQAGEHMVYERRLCPMENFALSVRTLAADTQGGRVRGCNVTLPFKFEVPGLAHRVTARAALAQAANVLRFDGDEWLADNTDGVGLMRDLQAHEGIQLKGARVLVIGAGGAARGVLGPLLECRPARVHVCNRTPHKAEALVQRHLHCAELHGVLISFSGLDTLAQAPADGAFDLVINASASSMGGSTPPLSHAVFAAGSTAVDLMYGPPAQIFLRWAVAGGAGRAVDGLGMLVEQAAEAFALWRGVHPQTRPVLQALRQRLAQAEHHGV